MNNARNIASHEFFIVNTPDGRRQGAQWSESTGRIRPVTELPDGTREFGRWVKSSRPKVTMVAL